MAMIFTALLEKFAAFTVEQKKQLTAHKDMDMAALEAFCKTHGIDLAADERGAMAEYFKTGKMPLADQELENVAAGQCSTSIRIWPPAILMDWTRCPKCKSANCYHLKSDGTARTGVVCDAYMPMIFTNYCCKDCGHKWDLNHTSWKP
jgi:hypothetical protein